MSEQRSVAIAGGTGWLGRAVTAKLLGCGATCHVTWLFESELDGLPEHERMRLHKVDCTSEQEVADFYWKLDRLDASIHLVGGFAMSPLVETSLADFDRMWTLNVRTAFLCCREAVRKFRAAGVGGRIVNVGARPAVAPVGGMVAYTSSKAAVTNLTQAVADEVRQDGILVNAVLPSIMDTPQNRTDMPDADFGLWPKVEEVAETIAFLVSPQNVLTSGALVPVYGRG